MGQDPTDIIMSLSDNNVNRLFYWMFTGGIGAQSGIPGKEWDTVTVQKLSDIKISEITLPTYTKIKY